jgi:hypothetical protein
MGKGVRITTAKRADAECISHALVGYGSELESEGKRWAVQLLAASAPELTAFLAAVKPAWTRMRSLW